MPVLGKAGRGLPDQTMSIYPTGAMGKVFEAFETDFLHLYNLANQSTATEKPNKATGRTLVACTCKCGCAGDSTSSPAYSLFTKAFETDFLHLYDLTN